MDMEKCLVKIPWWKGGNYFDHRWIYKNKEKRHCSKCGLQQIFFGYHKETNTEDWRETWGERT